AGLRLHFVNSTGSATAADRLRTGLRRAIHAAFVSLLPATAHAYDAQPQITPRSAWDGGHCTPRRTPGFSEVRLGIVHHTQGLNELTTGVSVIGSFITQPPPPEAVTAVERLLAWKLAYQAVPATGHTTVVTSGGSLSGRRAGSRITLNRVSGHRDADATDCP